MTLKDILKRSVLKFYKSQNDFEFYDWFYDFLDDISWVQIENEDGKFEQLNIENLAITELNDYSLELYCYGNSQMPHKVEITIEDDEIIATDLGESDFPRKSLNEIQFCEKLGIADIVYPE